MIARAVRSVQMLPLVLSLITQGSVVITFAVPPPAALVRDLLRDLNGHSVERSYWRFSLHDKQSRQEWTGPAVVVEVTGSCRVPEEEVRWRRSPLGSVQVVDGEWQPFVHVDCGRIAELVLRTGGLGRQEEKLARALALVIRHELLHLIRQSRVHDVKGEFRSSIPARECVQ